MFDLKKSRAAARQPSDLNATRPSLYSNLGIESRMCTISNLDGKTVLLMPDDSHPLHGFTRRSSFRGQQTSPAGSRVAASGDDALSPREGATESRGAASTGAPST